MNTIAENLLKISQQIRATERAVDRPADSVRLLVVSKQQSGQNIRDAYQAGQQAFGENYVQEALVKMEALKDLPIEWHFIGHIQANKTRAIAEHFAWVHSVDREAIATRLNAQRPANLPPLQICIQVNLAHEPQKHGVVPAALLPLAQAITALPRLTLRGLMLINPEHLSDAESLAYFRQLAALQTELQQHGFAVDTLSMGMSEDFPLAIAAGATLVRIGSAIFGKRVTVIK